MCRKRLDLSLIREAQLNLPNSLFVNFASAVGAAIVLYRQIPTFALVWLALTTLFTSLRLISLISYRVELAKLPPEQDAVLKFIQKTKLLYGGGLVSAALWWQVALLAASTTNVETKFTVMIIMAALAGGAMGITAFIEGAGRAYISALLIPGMFILFFGPNPNPVLALLTFAFWAVMMAGLKRNFTAIYQNFELEAQNRSLIDDLTALNSSLEKKVEDRTRDLEYAALRDPLTNLPNRRGFRSALHNKLVQARRNGARVAVGVIDLDGFKPVNDAFGHATGDQLLIEVSKRLETQIHGDNFVARLGGDEFGFVITSADDITQAQQIGNSICRGLAAPYVLSGVVAEIGASVGICVFPDDSDDADDLCEKADYALYHAKQSNKGTAVVFDANHAAEIRELAQMEQVLKRANLEDEIHVVFQPIIDIRTHKIRAFEALARWKSPVLGNVPPGLFIRAAERSGLILVLTRHLLTKALEHAITWPSDVGISINLSARDIASMDAVEELIAIVRNSGIAPGRIDFEITETALVCDFEQAREALNAFHRIGADIALDDFGTGHSSLSYLRLLPIDKLKVDSSFISDIQSNQTSEDIVRTLIQLCTNMRIDCIVEGIETTEQLDIVKSMGGHLLQGYHFARPMPATDIAAHLLNASISSGTEHHHQAHKFGLSKITSA